MSAPDIVAMVQRHYLPDARVGRPTAGLFATEVESPCGTRRADALWQPFTQHGGGLIGHEVKVSRADVLAELADPTKADAWARHCERWWLTVADAAIVEGVDVPEAWGIMAPPTGRRTRSMTVLREAPRLKPISPEPALRRLLAWDHQRALSALANLTRERDDARRDAHAKQQTVAALQLNSGEARPDAQRVHAILGLLDARCAEEKLWGRVDDDAVVEALLDHLAVTRATHDARRRLDVLLSQVERAVAPMQQVHADLQRGQRDAPQ